jgi:hypothetical protein
MSAGSLFPSIIVFDDLRLMQESLYIGDSPYQVSVGAWAFWVPAFRVKILHAFGGQAHCLASSAPPREQLLAGKFTIPDGGRYSTKDWHDALSKNVLQRAAENFLAAQRLHAAGLGPAALGVCLVRRFQAWYASEPGYTAGVMVEDLNLLPRKWRKVTAQQMLDAGVRPDRILSSVRQQIRGYVSDLNSVVGVMPIDAEHDIQRLTVVLRDCLRTCESGSEVVFVSRA